MLKTIIAINLIFFYIIISFVVFYVKRSKIETIEIISISKQSKNRKIINNRKETIEQEMNYSIFWPKLLFEYLKNEFKRYRNKRSKI